MRSYHRARKKKKKKKKHVAAYVRAIIKKAARQTASLKMAWTTHWHWVSYALCARTHQNNSPLTSEHGNWRSAVLRRRLDTRLAIGRSHCTQQYLASSYHFAFSGHQFGNDAVPADKRSTNALTLQPLRHDRLALARTCAQRLGLNCR